MSKLTKEEVIQDLYLNHNHSWYTELYNRNKNNLDDIALLYRGTKITYRELFENIERYARSLKSMGVGKNSEIPVCVSNSPEIVYIMGAASMIGAKINIFGAHFPTDYITEILNKSESDILFVEDNNYEKIKEAINQSGIKKIVVNSLSDSLKDGINPYKEIEINPTLFDSKVDDIKQNDQRVLSQKDFIDNGIGYAGNVYENIDMDQDFVITYTSGSTNEDRPKAIVHSSKNFIFVARYHDKDYNGINTKNFTSLAHIPTYSNTDLVSSISDSLMQGAKLGMEPVYGKDSFINSLIIYKPHFVAATKSFWVYTSKKVLYDKSYENVRFENLVLAFSCGEPFEVNEEKFINKGIKKAKAGTAFTHTNFSVVKMSEAAGDCEHGSIFYSIFRAYQNKLPKNIARKEASGLTYFPFVEIAVLDEEGRYFGPNRLGRLVANSPCTMKRYNNNEEATKKFFIKDASGKEWADLSLYGYLDETNKVHIYGRMLDNCLIHPSIIAKRILKDTKNILSCEVVYDEASQAYIAHVEMYPEARKGITTTINGANQRCKDLIDELGINLYFRVRSNEESFPLTKSGKRDVKKLIAEGLSKECFKPMVEPAKTNNKLTNIRQKVLKK